MKRISNFIGPDYQEEVGLLLHNGGREENYGDTLAMHVGSFRYYLAQSS